MRQFVEAFEEALASELEPLVELRIHRDERRLQGGDFYNRELAPANLRR